MKDEIMEFYNNFNTDDMKDFLWNMDLLALLSHPAVVTASIALGLLSIYAKWRLIIITFLSYVFLYGYLFITFVVIKNSEISSGSTFVLLLSAVFLIAGLTMYKRLTK